VTAPKSSPYRPAVVPVSAPKPKTSVDDLRNVLARISKAAAEPEKPKSESLPNNNVLKSSAAPLSSAAVSPLKAALSALEKIDNQAPRELPPRPVSVSDLPPLTPSERAEILQMANETEVAFAALESKQSEVTTVPTATTDTAHTTKKTTKPESENPLNPKAVAKLLRSTGTERSPLK
jgi:hypothetical protein